MEQRTFLKLTPKLFQAVLEQLDPNKDADVINRMAKLQGQTTEWLTHDDRQITSDQRAKIFAMIHDYCAFNYGWTDKHSMLSSEMDMKLYFWEKTKQEPFSLSNCSIDQASSFIEFLIEFFYEWRIPWATKTWDLLEGDPGRMYYGVKYRVCCICGNEAQWAHVHAVGSGRSRRKVDHRGNYVMPLCYKHHQEQHNIGIWSFMEKYHIKGIKVDDEINAMLQYRHLQIDDADDDTRGKDDDKQERSLGAS